MTALRQILHDHARGQHMSATAWFRYKKKNRHFAAAVLLRARLDQKSCQSCELFPIVPLAGRAATGET